MDLGASAGEDVTGMLQRLVALDVATLDESLARSIRRVLQMGAVLAGARLADEEIRALPKVRFEQADKASQRYRHSLGQSPRWTDRAEGVGRVKCQDAQVVLWSSRQFDGQDISHY